LVFLVPDFAPGGFTFSGFSRAIPRLFDPCRGANKRLVTGPQRVETTWEMTATRSVGLEEGGAADGFDNGSNRTPSSSKDAHIMRNCSSIRPYTLADGRVLIPVTLPHTPFLYQCSREGLGTLTPPHFSCGKLDQKVYVRILTPDIKTFFH
jgi:hypothetical protein